MQSEVKPDWRVVKCEQKGMCGESFAREAQIATCGVYYVLDANLHVHICSFTPSLEAWPVQGYATFLSDEAAERDEGEIELEMLSSEDGVSYFDVNVLSNPNRSLSDYMDIPEREDGETDEKYRERIADAAREQFCGNSVEF